jgi:thioredoxin 1
MPEIRRINEETFDEEVMKSNIPTLVDFWTPQCVPCRSLSVILEKFSQTVEGKLKIVKVNAEECARLASRFGVLGVPTLMLFRNGKAVATKTGVLLPHELRRWIGSCLPEHSNQAG